MKDFLRKIWNAIVSLIYKVPYDKLRLSKLADRLEEDDVDLHYGNGTAASQVDCAIAAIESILQEY